MWTNNSTIRTLVWLAIFAIPLQYVPTSACGCSRSISGSTAGRCPCTGATVCQCDNNSCCNSAATANTCSSNNPSNDVGTFGCQCGENCQCGSQKQPIDPPLTPVENTDPVEKLAKDSLSIASIAEIRPFPTRLHRRNGEKSVAIEAVSSLTRCVSLCRFAL